MKLESLNNKIFYSIYYIWVHKLFGILDIILQTVIYVCNQVESNYLINFSALTKRNVSFIVSREKYDNFTLTDMIGKTVIGGIKGVLL